MYKQFKFLVTLLLLAVSVGAWGQSDLSATETSNVTLTAGTNGSTCTVNNKDGIKVGTSSKGGDLSVTVPAGTTHLHLHAAAWKGVSGLSLNISGATVSPTSISLTADDGISSNSPFTLSGNASDFYFVIELSNITAETTLTFATSIAKRFVMWGVNAEEYTGGGSQLDDNDLALTGAPIALSFDLYDNADPQVINYTTSSTGAVSIAANNYANFVIDETNKKITVTPTAVTSGEQTITVSQAADNDYKAGTATFTLTITDSTPASSGDVTFVAGTDKGSTTTTNADEVSKQGVTISSTSAALASSEYRLYSGSKTTFSVADGYVITKIVFTEASSSYPISRLTPDVGTLTELTWTGEANEVTFTASGQARASKIVVTVASAGTVKPTPTVSIDATGITNTNVYDGTAAGSLSATVMYNNAAVAGATVTWSGDNDAVATIDNSGAVTLVGAGTVTFTATYAGNNDYNAATATYVMTVTNNDPNAPGTENNPYTVAEARAAIDAGTGVTSVYVTGIVCEGGSNLSSGAMNYWISDDGTETDKFEIYKGKGINGESFSSTNDVQIGDVVIVYGNLKKYNTTYEFDSGSRLVSLTRPANTEPSITVSTTSIGATYAGKNGTIDVTYSNITNVAANVYFCDANGDAASYNWVTANINNENNVEYVVSANDGDARTAYMKVHALDDNNNDVYSELITFTQTAAPAGMVTPIIGNGKYELVTDASQLVAGKRLIIVGENNGTYQAMGSQNTNNRVAVNVTVSNNVIVPSADVAIVTLQGQATDKWLLQVNEGFLYAASSTSNYLRSREDITDDCYLYIDIDNDGKMSPTFQGTNTHCVLQYNSSSSLFSCYGSASQKPISIYMEQELVDVTFSEEDADNTKLVANNGKTVNATLTRTLSADYWSTFSVPFNATAQQIEDALGTVELHKFLGSTGTVITFEDATEIEAGHAYLVKPAATVTNPVFEGVTVVNTTGEMDADNNNFGFVGAVIKYEMALDGTELFLRTDGKFSYPTDTDNSHNILKGLRAYFIVPTGTNPSKLMIDVDGVATAIDNMNIDMMQNGNVYNMNGQMVGTSLNGLQKGIYLMNGKKVIVK